jgi:hypothetical protein
VFLLVCAVWAVFLRRAGRPAGKARVAPDGRAVAPAPQAE